MSDLLSGLHGFHSTAIQASRQSDLPLASVYPQVQLVTLAIKSLEHLMTQRYTKEDMSLTSTGDCMDGTKGVIDV